jgi:hypothetical protein
MDLPHVGTHRLSWGTSCLGFFPRPSHLVFPDPGSFAARRKHPNWNDDSFGQVTMRQER